MTLAGPRLTRHLALSLCLGLALSFAHGGRLHASDDSMETAKSAPSAGLGPRALGVEGLPEAVGATPEQQDVARAAGRDVVCLCGTCPKRTITDCDCGWARVNQIAILNAVVKGRSRLDVVETYRKAYGDQVLALVPNEGFARMAWAFPYAAGVVGLGVVFLVGRALRRRGTGTGTGDDGAPGAGGTVDDPAAKAELKRQLEDLD